MALISELVTKVTADTSQFTKAMDQAKGKVSGFSSAMKGLFTVGAVTGLLHQFDQTIEKIDKIGDSAKKLSISTDAFQKLTYVAKLSDSSIEAVEHGMNKLVKSVYSGGKEATAALTAIGLSADKLRGMSIDQIYLKVNAAIGQVKNSTDQLAIAQALYGKNAIEQMPIIKSNVAELGAEYDTLGSKLSAQQIEQAGLLSDAKKRFAEVFQGFIGSAATDLAPAFASVINGLSNIMLGLKGVITWATQAGEALKNAFSSATGIESPLTWLQNDLSAAFDRIAMVKNFAQNALSGAGFSASPNMIGTVGSPDIGGKSSAGLQSIIPSVQMGSKNNPVNLEVKVSTTEGFNMKIANSQGVKAAIAEGARTMMAQEAAGMR